MAETDFDAADVETEMMVLRISPCRESGAVVSGVSPVLGRMAFYKPDYAGGRRRGADGVGGDLFQCLSIKCQPAHSNGGDDDFYKIAEASLEVDCSAVAMNYERYQAACWLAAFAMRNSLPHMAMPKYYNALKTALRRLCAGDALPDCVLTGAGLVFLYEGGWLDTTNMSKEEISQCEVLINMALDLGPMPDLTDDVWRQLWDWTQSRLVEAIPD